MMFWKIKNRKLLEMLASLDSSRPLLVFWNGQDRDSTCPPASAATSLLPANGNDIVELCVGP